ncbi:putative membrane protein [Bacillus thermophilus]|uniref:Membrane protein n=1 Tax=Siminovitchia thermophila TaxID=1245522 RepID=A0ABS2R5U8_9BACI|nr:DUF368 domain-containing protein [Siminovitchia thermophila]MBM7714992.1 putative membrane protein [Siminovitchia thermophila]ONK22361.1 DUF368 domain-containing protein [Bacillus sp. VT-16-64]
MEWKNIYRGIVMGASDVIPGVSGGTIAVLLGIYDRLIEAINGVFSKGWKKQLSFLIPLGFGIVLSIFSLSRLMEWLLHTHPGPTYFFFLGLILGVLPFLFRQARAKSTFKAQQYILLAIGAILIASLAFLNESEGAVIENMTFATYFLLFVSGFIGSSAMILPGISGSFILLVIGVYPTVIGAISNFKLDIIAVTGAGIALGIIIMSKVIHYFLTHYRISTFAVIIGMVIGSFFVIFPGWPANLTLTFVSILTFIIGLVAAYILGKIEY